MVIQRPSKINMERKAPPPRGLRQRAADVVLVESFTWKGRPRHQGDYDVGGYEPLVPIQLDGKEGHATKGIKT